MTPAHPPGPLLTIRPFVGHRLWRVVPGPRGALLAAEWAGLRWEGPTLEGRCRPQMAAGGRSRHQPGEPVPAVGCSCGVYAARRIRRPTGVGLWATAPVELTGRVIEGALGYRAGRARILGPLQLEFGRDRCPIPRCGGALAAVSVRPTAYRFHCADHADAGSDPLAGYLRETAAGLRSRYGVAVIPPPPGS